MCFFVVAYFQAFSLFRCSLGPFTLPRGDVEGPIFFLFSLFCCCFIEFDTNTSHFSLSFFSITEQMQRHTLASAPNALSTRA